MNKLKYRAFISYSHADEKWAAWLHRRLETYRLPKHIVRQHGLDSNRLIPIFRDRDELASSVDLSTVINQALEESENLIVVCSRDSAGSHWVNEEISRFKQLGRADRVFHLLVDDPDSSFPPASLVDVDGDGTATSAETEPLAADARPQGDGKQGAHLKLIAGMLDIGLDDLRQRETHRRQKRLATISAVSLLIMVLTSGLAIYAVIAQMEATRQHDIAVVERDRAELETNKAVAVNEFLQEILGSADPYERLGRDVTVMEALAEAVNRLDRFDEQAEIQAAVQETIGRTYGRLGKYELARELQEASLANRQELYGEDHPDIAANFLHRAWLDRITGNAAAGLARGQEALEMLRRLASDETEAFAVGLHEVAWSQNDLGNFDEAETYFRQALELSRNLFEAPHLELAEALSSLGTLLSNRSRYEDAMPLIQNALEQRIAILGTESLIVAGSQNTLGLMSIRMGRIPEAEDLIEQSLATRRALLGEEHAEVAESLNSLASVYTTQGKNDLAIEAYRETLKVYRSLFGDEHINVGRALHGIAAAHGLLKNWDDAVRYYRESLEVNIAVVGPDHIVIGIVRNSLAGALIGKGEYSSAEEQARESVRLHVLSLDDDHWRVASARSVWAKTLMELGRYDEAESLLLQAHPVLESVLGSGAGSEQVTRRRLVELYEILDKPAEVARFREGLADSGDD